MGGGLPPDRGRAALIGALLEATGWVLGGAVALAQWRLRCVSREAIVRAGHELRGPLAAARLGLELCARGGELTAVRLRAVDLELERAAVALEDLAAASAPGRVRPVSRRAPVDVEELLRECAAGQEGAASSRGVRLAVRWTGEQASVWGDRVRLGQALRNLLSNALEHGGGEVQLSGRLTGSMIRVEVSDRGPGLPAPVGELARRSRRGRALRGRGLAIACDIVTAHGGRLAAAPSQRGARLVLELPAIAERWHRHGGEPGPSRAG